MIEPGTLLVSHPKFTQGIFARSVVLIAKHTVEGTNGFIINKPTQYTMRDLVDGLDLDSSLSQTVYHGGPVSLRNITMLHSDGWYGSKTFHISNGVSVSSDRTMLDKLNCDNNYAVL